MSELKIVEFNKEPEMKEFDLTQEQVDEMQALNSRLIALKNLTKEFGATDSDAAFTRVIDELGKTQEAYDQWFVDRQEEFKATTTPANRWNVDFVAKKLQLL